MATATVGSLGARSATPVPLFTTTTNQFDKTVFTGKSSPAAVVLPTAITLTTANLSYSTSTGVYSLEANITYQMIAYGTISNYSSATPATIQWYNSSTGAAIGSSVPVGGTLITTYKPATSHGVVLKVNAGSSAFDYPTKLDTNFRTHVQVVGGWTE